jgi:hypothetical protein
MHSGCLEMDDGGFRWKLLAGVGSNFPMMDWNESLGFSIG